MPKEWELQPINLQDPAVQDELSRLTASAIAFLKVPGASLTLADWRQLGPVSRAAFIQAGVEVEAERLMKLRSALVGGELGLADAISEYDGGAAREAVRLKLATEAAVRRINAHSS